MAGSWNHAIDDDGSLLEPDDLARMLENGGDVWEFAKEAYGMVWFLATSLAEETWNWPTDPRKVIEIARQKYKEGLNYAEEAIKKGKS